MIGDDAAVGTHNHARPSAVFLWGWVLRGAPPLISVTEELAEHGVVKEIRHLCRVHAALGMDGHHGGSDAIHTTSA